MYDFILFENFYQAFNHYKDLCIIAQYLKHCGYSVAIADVFGEAENCQVEDVPHIGFDKKCPVSFNWNGVRRTDIVSNIKNSLKRKRIDDYLIYIMRQLCGQYRNLYAGSYFVHMTTGWLKEIPDTASVFFWGLRSSRLIEHKLKPFSKVALPAFRLRRYFDRHQSLKFFVSDEIIKDEFIELGISPQRLVIRPERYIEEMPSGSLKKEASNGLGLLSIGSLREAKQIEKILDSLRQLNDDTITYTIAGKAYDEYETLIESHTKGLHGVTRRNYRIPEEEYNQLIEQCDFLILCDRQQLSSVTNGTMNEALLKGKPIIAPNYNPYKFYIEKYGIGITFDPESIESLSSVILDAKQKGVACFADNIKNYQRTLLFDVVAERFGKELAESLTYKQK